MPELTPEHRSLRASLAAHESWAYTHDRAARTANARKAADDRFEKQVDPNGELTPAERAVRAGTCAQGPLPADGTEVRPGPPTPGR